ncbi:MAG: hypothetical protein B7Y84_08150 [Azorhizobium sp. 32-67-21]|nr:MAG: hypothetical protein B7Y84_08150 [Azorhizobium sp. 32-67-21]
MPPVPATPFGRLAARWRRLPFFWQAQITGWTLFAFVDFANRDLAYQDLRISMIMTLVVCPVLLLLSCGLKAIYDRMLPEATLTLAVVGRILALSTLAATLVIVLVSTIRTIFSWSIPDWRPFEQISIPLIHYTFVLSGWSLCYFWVRAEVAKRSALLRASSATTEALRFEIQHLRLQLDPHFLFNALNGIGEEIAENPPAALTMLRDLTDYLRHSLAGIDTPIVPVEAEATSLRAYLRIQEARFGPRLATRITLDPAAARRPIANFLLQPLVENAVKYGARDRLLEVGIDIRLAEGALRIEVTNTGSLEGTVRRRGRGIGLKNLRRRLAVHYPGRARFTLGEVPDPASAGVDPATGRVVATLVLEGEPCSAS